MSQDIKTDLQQGIFTITLTRPQKKNALTDEMYKVLADSIEQAEQDSQVRVVLIQGEGDLFCAGNDVGVFAAIASGNAPKERHTFRFLHNLAQASKPIIAAVQGKAVGIGTTVLLHCDYVLVADNAELITPFINLALVPEAASSFILPNFIGHVRAFEMFALGEPVKAEQAVAWGLANKQVALDQLQHEAQLIATKFASKPLGSMTAMKKLMRESERIIKQMDKEGEVFAQRLLTAEAQEAFTAFAEKRQPDFSRVSTTL